MESLIKRIEIKKAKKVDKEQKDVQKSERAKKAAEDRKKRLETTITMQDIISCSAEDIVKHLKGYEKIEEADYKFVKPNSVIRYLRKVGDDQYKLVKGGKMMSNNYPDYFMLKPVHNFQGGLNKPWSVQLKDGNILYKRTGSDIQYEAVEEMYLQIRSGKFRIIRTDFLQYLIENQKPPEDKRNYFWQLSQRTIAPLPEKETEPEKDKDEQSYDSGEEDGKEEPTQRRQTTVELIR